MQLQGLATGSYKACEQISAVTPSVICTTLNGLSWRSHVWRKFPFIFFNCQIHKQSPKDALICRKPIRARARYSMHLSNAVAVCSHCVRLRNALAMHTLPAVASGCI